MCPLIAPPNRGYGDWQRVDNYDTGSVWTFDQGAINTGVFSPIIDCSRFAYVGGFFSSVLSSTQVTLQWYLDALGAVTIGTRTFTVDQNIISFAQARILNLGPFVRVELSPVVAGNYHPAASLFLSNRNYPLEMVPSVPVLIDKQNAPIAANATLFVYPTDYYAGPVGVWMNPSAGPFVFRFEHLITTGAWDIFDQFTVAGGDSRFTTVAPPGAWRVEVDNSTAAPQTYYLAVTPSLTGGT